MIASAFTYQLAGPGRAWQRVVYDPRRIADCRAFLTERLGPLSYFAEVEAEQPAAEAQSAADDPAPTAAPPNPPPRSLIPHGVLPAEEIGICVGLDPIAKWVKLPDEPTSFCDWFVDTTGEVFRRCGEPVFDGRELCAPHRFHRARVLLEELPCDNDLTFETVAA